MTNETKKSGATADRLAAQVVVDGRSNGFADGVVLRWPDDRQVATIDPSKVLFCNPGQELVAVRAWLVEQIEAGYKAGVDACVVTLSEAAREKEKAVNIATTALQGELREALGVDHGWEECLATVRELVAKDKAKPAPTDAAAEDAAIDGLVRDAFRDRYSSCSALTRAGEESYLVTGISTGRARGWLRPWLLAAWARGVAYGQQPDAPSVLADSFGVAAREQVAAERAVDAAAVAPSEEALARARTEGAVEAFRKVAEWCQTSVPDGIDLDASIVEEVANDAIGTLQHAAGAGDEKMREEGRRLGWKEAIAAVMRAHDAERRDVKRATDVAREMRKEADHAEDTRSRLALRAVATGNVLDAVTAAAPKEAP